MKPTNTPKTSVVTIDNKPEQLVEKAETQNTSKKVVNDTSTQRQLLNLAKQFSLVDGLRSPEKQIPIIERVTRHDQACKIRKQQNLEAIIYQALEYSSADEIADRADADWFNNFILLAENIGNPSMQALWAKILAGEIAKPGSFSFKALNVFKNMSMTDAKLLAKARSLSVKDINSNAMRIISGVYQKPTLLALLFGKKEYRLNLAEFGLNYSDLLALSENKLLFMQEAETKPLLKNENLTFDYNGTSLNISFKMNNVCLNFYKFTAIGNELSQLIANSPKETYLTALKQNLSHFHIIN